MKTKSSNRTERTMVTLTPEEKAESKRLAQEMGMSSESAMYRYFLISHLKKEAK